MSARPRRSTRKQSVMGNHQRCWLWGRHLVIETLEAQRWPILELVVSDELVADDADRVRNLAERDDVPVTIAPPERLTQLSGANDHQGLLAKMSPFPFSGLQKIMSSTADPLALVMLDRIQDPHNFGAIIRVAEVLGLHGMVIGDTHQSAVTSAVARSSAGAVNHLPICRESDLRATVETLRTSGVHLVATAMRSGVPLSDWNFTQPTAILMGNESTGVADELLNMCDATVHIPQGGHVESLNAAVAAGIVCYELQRQRGATPRESPNQ